MTEHAEPDATAQAIADNATVLEAELAWLNAVIDARFSAYLDGKADAALPPMPSLADKPGSYAAVARPLDQTARLTVILALAPHLAPQMLDPFLLTNQATGRGFTEFGGVPAHAHSGFLPTIETALFLLAGAASLQQRIALMMAFYDHPLMRDGILLTDDSHSNEPHSAAPLRVSQRGLRLLLTGG